eukprot:13834350-Alexandrium_andersonii.AAC.1
MINLLYLLCLSHPREGVHRFKHHTLTTAASYRPCERLAGSQGKSKRRVLLRLPGVVQHLRVGA